jgi:hypothetical protein
VSCWGDNDYGETSVPNLSNPTQVSAGQDYTCAIDDTGVACKLFVYGTSKTGDSLSFISSSEYSAAPSNLSL